MAHRLVKWMLVGSLALLIVALWRKDILPDNRELRDELLAEPVQVETDHAPIQTTVGGIHYTIQPLYTYTLYGLVVSKHNADTWWDYIHNAWNDKLNVADLCVVWGNDVRNSAYKGVSFSHSQFTCDFSTDSKEAFDAFDQSAYSNNHLITDNARLAGKVRSASVGDQIYFRGYLADYSHNHDFSFKRKTSTVRTDTGNGACEVVYLEDFDILQRGGGPWHFLLKVAILLMIAGVTGWFVLPARPVD